MSGSLKNRPHPTSKANKARPKFVNNFDPNFYNEEFRVRSLFEGFNSTIKLFRMFKSINFLIFIDSEIEPLK